MAQITRLQSALLAKVLGIRTTGALVELADTVLPVLSIEPYLLPPALEGASPTPTALRGFERPPIKITTGEFSVPASSLRTGVFELFGGALVAGTDQATKDTNFADPPNREWELWGFSSALLKVPLAQMEMDWILSTERVAFTFDGPEILQDNNDLHGVSAWDGRQEHFILPVPYIIPPNTELTWQYTVNNLEAVARNVQHIVRFYWKYAS